MVMVKLSKLWLGSFSLLVLFSFVEPQSFLQGLLGICSCPCRTYTVRRCVHTYQESCDYSGHAGRKKCKKQPRVAAKYVTETECQKCRELTETEIGETSKLVCDPVYDETCSTKYSPKCGYTQACSTIYTQDCSAQSYGEECMKLPQQKCRKVKKCVRNPKTRCRPVKRMECGMKKFLAPKEVKHQRCLPYPNHPTDEDCNSISVHNFLPPRMPLTPAIPETIEQDHDNSYEEIKNKPKSPLAAHSYEANPNEPYHQTITPLPIPLNTPYKISLSGHHFPFYPSAKEELFLPSHTDINVKARD